MHATNVFAGPYLDRASHLRHDPDWFAHALADAGSRVLVVWNTRNLFVDGDPPRAAYLPLGAIPKEQHTVQHLILLGCFEGTHFFAYEAQSADAPAAADGTHFEDLRSVATLLSEHEAGLLSYARALLFWRRRNRFCGICGMPTQSIKAGHVLMCTNTACRHETFPRTDSAIIVLVSDGDRALLGRQASWPRGRYSTIAGFVEPGESLEDPVARAVFEETGAVVDEAAYHSPQPWPFPSSLMLGFTAHAATTAIDLRDQELEDARWFTRADLAAGSLMVPPTISISFRLIEDWFDAGWRTPLRELHSAITWSAPR